MNPDLTDDDKIALNDLLTRTIDEDRYPLSLRIRKLEAILAKLDPQAIPTPISYPAPKQYKPPRAVLAKRRVRSLARGASESE